MDVSKYFNWKTYTKNSDENIESIVRTKPPLKINSPAYILKSSQNPNLNGEINEFYMDKILNPYSNLIRKQNEFYSREETTAQEQEEELTEFHNEQKYENASLFHRVGRKYGYERIKEIFSKKPEKDEIKYLKQKKK